MEIRTTLAVKHANITVYDIFRDMGNRQTTTTIVSGSCSGFLCLSRQLALVSSIVQAGIYPAVSLNRD